MHRFLAFNRTKRQAYYLGIGDWRPDPDHDFRERRDNHALVMAAIVTKDYMEEMGRDFGFVVNAIVEDLLALDINGIVEVASPEAKEFFDYTVVGSRYRSRWGEHRIPPGVTVDSWLKGILP